MFDLFTCCTYDMSLRFRSALGDGSHGSTISSCGHGKTCQRQQSAHLSRLLDGVVTVSETEIAVAMRLAAERARLIVEPSGALALAAAHFHGPALGLDRVAGTVVAIISGGNVDLERLPW